MQSTMIGYLRASRTTDAAARVARAGEVLREARARVGAVGGLSAIVAALDEVDQLVPGVERCLQAPPSSAHAELAAEVRALLDAFERAYCEPILRTAAGA